MPVDVSHEAGILLVKEQPGRSRKARSALGCRLMQGDAGHRRALAGHPPGTACCLEAAVIIPGALASWS